MENASDAIRSLAVKVYDILAVNSSTVYPVVAYDHDNPSFVVSSLVCSILMIIVGTIGLFSNSFIIYVFSRTYPASSMNILIIGLAVADTVLVVSATPVYSLLALYADQPPQHVVIILNYLIVSLYPLSMMSQCASVWMLVVITAERFIAVCYPLAARRICTGRRAVMALLFVAVLSVLYNGCRFWEYTVDNGSQAVPLLRQDQLYVQVYVHWMYFFTVFGVPLCVLVLFNSCIVHTIVRAHQQRCHMSISVLRQHRLAVMMIMIVVEFFVCNSLAFVLNALEAGGYFNGVTENMALFYFLMDINNLLIELDSSTNFIVYMIFCRQFQKRFLCIFKAVRPPPSESVTVTFNNSSRRLLLKHRSGHYLVFWPRRCPFRDS